jgi:dTDP-4-dehydrorhamnose 3,5-epimerase
MWIPPGFAHGFVVTSETADFAYKCTRAYAPKDERVIRWNDPELAIEWPVTRDGAAAWFKDSELPDFTS